MSVWQLDEYRSTRYGGVRVVRLSVCSELRAMIQKYRSDISLEVQQRACEYEGIFETKADAV